MQKMKKRTYRTEVEIWTSKVSNFVKFWYAKIKHDIVKRYIHPYIIVSVLPPNNNNNNKKKKKEKRGDA